MALKNYIIMVVLGSLWIPGVAMGVAKGDSFAIHVVKDFAAVPAVLVGLFAAVLLAGLCLMQEWAMWGFAIFAGYLLLGQGVMAILGVPVFDGYEGPYASEIMTAVGLLIGAAGAVCERDSLD